MPNTIYANDGQALESLKTNKFRFTKRDGEKITTATHPQFDAYLDGYAKVAAFLCNTQAFEGALNTVSANLWAAYRAFGVDLRNKFSRALNKVAAASGFEFQSRFVANTNFTRPIGIKLVGGDPQLGFMLRKKLFWKDSMDLHHGEYSHSLQWLAIAAGLPGLNPPAAELYAGTADFRAPSQDSGNEVAFFMWQWIADCFPTSMNNLATAKFKNGETLESQSYRSPQVIMDYLLQRNAGPIAGHFVSNYLFYRYKNRQWLTTKSVNGGAPVIDKLYTGDPKVMRQGSVGAQSWTQSPRSPNRLLRDTNQYRAIHDMTSELAKVYPMTFHNQDGDLTYFYEA